MTNGGAWPRQIKDKLINILFTFDVSFFLIVSPLAATLIERIKISTIEESSTMHGHEQSAAKATMYMPENLISAEINRQSECFECLFSTF